MSPTVRFLGIPNFLWTLLWILVTSLPAAAQTKVTMGHAGATLLRLPLYMAVQNGYFKQQGIDLQIVDTRSGSDTMVMLAGGAVDTASGQLLDLVNLNRQGLPARGVLMLSQRFANSIVVRKDLVGTIKSVKDLKGRTVGVTAVGSGTWQFAAYLASLEGLKPSDIIYIGVGGGASVLAAVRSQRVDAMSYADPENPTLVQSGDAAFLIDTADEATHDRLFGRTYLNNQILVLESYAKEHPDAVQGIANAIQQALNWIHQHSVADIVTVLQTYPSYASAERSQLMLSVQRMYPSGVPTDGVITQEAFDSAFKLAHAVGAVRGDLAYDRIINTEFARRAAEKFPSARR